MPKEYIEREALIARYDAEHVGPPGRARELMATAPVADVVEVRHGRWVFGKDLADSFGSINKNKYHLYCSECHNQAFNKSTDNDWDFDMDTPFCPWCGAKMDKEVDDETCICQPWAEQT